MPETELRDQYTYIYNSRVRVHSQQCYYCVEMYEHVHHHQHHHRHHIRVQCERIHLFT